MHHESSQQIPMLDERQKLDVEEQMKQALAIVAHDLKTPLTGVKLYADILLSLAEEADAVTRAKYLAVISSEADRMSRMIANIVDYQKIISTKAEWHDEEADVATVVARCVKPYQLWCAAKGISFSYTTDVGRLVILIDVDRFARLVSGLLSNALRFTESGGIKLELRSDNARFFLAVSDSGPGIDEERLQALFKPRVDVVSLSKDVGLAFATSVVDHYQGHIWAESVVGNGSTFYIELPLLHESIEV